ncbi:hypothetical protein EBZ80_01205 [bacterium]|nr:hypothetical protein [bacterium]
MQFLEPNKTDVYPTKVLSTELVRTGTDSSGSCFFYAVMQAFKSFRELDEERREDHIRRAREELAGKIGQEDWFTIQNGTMAFLQIIEMMRRMIHTIPEILEKQEEFLQKYDVNGRAVRILFLLLDPATVEREVLPLWDMECSKASREGRSFIEDVREKWFDIYKTKIQKLILDLEKKVDPSVPKMPEEQRQRVIQKLSLLSYPIFEFIVNEAHKAFLQEIRDPNKWLNLFIFLSVQKFMDLKVNVLLLDASTGMPYEGQRLIFKKKDFENDLNFVVLLYHKDMHYESLGRRIEENGRVMIKRIFRRNDPFIITCLTYLEGMGSELFAGKPSTEN